jgi:roadblock/LC7 domain-containing protein
MVMDDGKKYCWVQNGKLRKNEHGQMVPDRDPVPLSRLVGGGLVPPIFNASALPYHVWQRIDAAVVRASRDRLNAWNDLAAANTYGGFNGMAVTGIIKDTMTDPGDAKVSMDKLDNDLNDAPLFTPDILPLPIIHAGCEIGPRMLAMSRNSGMPIDTANFEACGRRCAETLEKMTIGMTDFSGLVIGSSSDFSNRGIYGFRTQPDRITKTDVGSFVPSTFVTDVIAMKELARAQRFYGPFVLYYSTNWDQYLARDYYYTATAAGLVAPQGTVMERVQRIAAITRVAMLDYFTSTSELLLVQMSADTVRAVDGMDWTPIQYEKPGGTGLVYRVMGIKVPDLRSQYVGTSTSSRKCGIVHGTTS